MAQIVQIAQSAQRNDLPDIDMKQRDYSANDFGGQIAGALGVAGGEMQKAAAIFQADYKQRENFNRLTALTDFETREQQRLAEAQRAAAGDGRDFTKSFMAQHDAQAQQLLAGVTDPTERAQWQQRMAQLRQGFTRGALTAELGVRDNHYGTTLATQQTPILNAVAANPAVAERERARGLEIINATGLPEPTKVQLRAKWEQDVQTARLMGTIQQDPAAAAAALGGTTPYRASLRQHESSGNPRAMAPTSSATGLYQFLDRTWNEVANSPEGRAAGVRPIGAGQARTDSDPRFDVEQNEKAIAIFTQKNMKALEAAGIQPNARNTYLAHFMGAGGAIQFIRQMDRAPNDAAETHFAEAAASNRQVFYRPDGSARTMREVYEIQTRRFANAGTPSAAPSQDFAQVPFQQQAQFRQQAERAATARQTEGDALMQQQQTQRIDQLMTAIVDGKAGRADVVAARDRGELTDFNSYKRALDLVAQQESRDYYTNQFNAGVTAGRQWNPLDTEDKKSAEAGVWALAKVNGNNVPQAAFQVWQQTGILAKPGAEALRGAMQSTDPQRMGAAYQIAASMLRANPNAFAGVDGGKELEQAAALFFDRVERRGQTADEAVRAIAEMNRPEAQAARQVRDEDAKRFRDELLKRDQTSTIRSVLDTNGWLPGGKGEMPIGARERGALMSDYVSAAEEHYQRFGDRSAALTYAQNEVKRLYGVSNGRIMRFPPERSYPAVEDADGNRSHGYVYSQAAAAVQSATGRVVKPEDITLVPIPFGITSERWRAGDRPPYEIWHKFTDATGQQRYEPVLSPNSTMARPWSADPAAAMVAATAARETRFNQRRAGPAPVTAADAPAGVARGGQDPQAWADQENQRRQARASELQAAQELYNNARAAVGRVFTPPPPAGPEDMPADRPDFRPIDEIDRTRRPRR